jgi:NADH-quinone oxidoreductase subunit N
VSVLPFLALAFGGAAATLLTRRSPVVSTWIGLLALGGAFLAAATISPDAYQLGGGSIAGSEYGRLFLVLGTGCGLIVALIGVLTDLPRNLAGALLAGLGGAGLALALPDPTTAVAATIAGGLAGVLVTLRDRPTPLNVAVAARELRAIAVAGALVLLATAWVSRPLETLVGDSPIFGLAYLAVGIGVAMRFGAIPFHLWVARVADVAPEVTLPLLTAWGPATLAIVGLAWVDGSIVPVIPITGDLPGERIVIVAVGLACLVLGAIAAWVQDDLEHVVGYATVQDAGIVVLAFAALDPDVWAASRTWIVVLLVARTAFAAWAVAVRARFGSRRIDDLHGWARRSPVLAVALLAIAVASVGWPGFAAFEARAQIIGLAVHGPLEGIVLAAVFLPLLYYGRLFAIGLARPTIEVAAVADDRPRAPLRQTTAVPAVAVGATPPEATGRRAIAGEQRGRARLPASRGPRTWAPLVGLIVDANRGLVAAGLALVLSIAAVLAAGGGLGLPAAAAEPAPAPAGLLPDLTGPGPSPDSSNPVPSGASATASPDASIPEPSAPGSTPPTAAPTLSPSTSP